jgi:hypothetical protein
LLADGARVTGFDRAGWYVLEQPALEQSVLQQSVLDDAEKGLA